MSGRADLGTALAAAQDRVVGKQPAPAAPPLSEADIRAALRTLAVAQGMNTDAVIASFDAGGALADLVRAALGALPRKRPKRGAPWKREAFDTFYEVCRLMDVDGLTKEQAIAAFAAANQKNEHTVAKRYERALSKGRSRRPGFTGRLADHFKDPVGNV